MCNRKCIIYYERFLCKPFLAPPKFANSAKFRQRVYTCENNASASPHKLIFCHLVICTSRRVDPIQLKNKHCIIASYPTRSKGTLENTQ